LPLKNPKGEGNKKSFHVYIKTGEKDYLLLFRAWNVFEVLVSPFKPNEVIWISGRIQGIYFYLNPSNLKVHSRK
jgi:hypothetical protein